MLEGGGGLECSLIGGAVDEGCPIANGGVVMKWRHQVLRQADASIVRRRVRGGVEHLYVVSPMEAHDWVFGAILRYNAGLEFELVVTCLLLCLPERCALIAVRLPRCGEHVLLPEYVRHRFRLMRGNLTCPVMERLSLNIVARFLCECYLGHLRDLGHWLRVLLRRGSCLVEL